MDKAEVGEASREEVDYILYEWENIDPTSDAWVVVSPDGVLCGYATLTLKSEAGLFIADGTFILLTIDTALARRSLN